MRGQLHFRWVRLLCLTLVGTLPASSGSLPAVPEGATILAYRVDVLPAVSWHASEAQVATARRIFGLFLVRHGEQWRAFAATSGHRRESLLYFQPPDWRGEGAAGSASPCPRAATSWSMWGAPSRARPRLWQ